MPEQEQRKWYFTVRQSSHSILVEIRPYEGEDGGYIAAFKHIDFSSQEIFPATVRIGLSLDGYGDWGMPLDKAWRLSEWVQVATGLAHQLDHYIASREDFKKRFEAVQYEPGGFCYVSPTREVEEVGNDR